MKHNRKTLYTNMPTRTYYPRTLEEAFGPGASWPLDRRSFGAKVLPWVAAGIVWLLLIALWWGAEQ